ERAGGRLLEGGHGLFVGLHVLRGGGDIVVPLGHVGVDVLLRLARHHVAVLGPVAHHLVGGRREVVQGLSTVGAVGGLVGELAVVRSLGQLGARAAGLLVGRAGGLVVRDLLADVDLGLAEDLVGLVERDPAGVV